MKRNGQGPSNSLHAQVRYQIDKPREHLYAALVRDNPHMNPKYVRATAHSYIHKLKRKTA